MAISATLTVTPAAPNHGDTVTAVYAVQGNDPSAPSVATVTGEATVGTDQLSVTTTITLPGVSALPETFAVPTCPGLTFVPTSNPTTFTALVP